MRVFPPNCHRPERLLKRRWPLQAAPSLRVCVHRRCLSARSAKPSSTRTRPHPSSFEMPITAANAGVGALLTAGVVVAFYQIQARRKLLPSNAIHCEGNGGTAASPAEMAANDPTAKLQYELKTPPEQLELEKQAQESKRPESPATQEKESKQDLASQACESQQEASDDSHWLSFTKGLLSAKASIHSVEWKKLVDFSSVFPSWTVGLPEWITKLQRELNMEPDSLAAEIWKEAKDPKVNPEVAWDAHVRLGMDLCEDEKRFLKNRRKFTRRALAKYLEIPGEEVHEEDVPVIAATGSGGGLRAMVAGSGYYQALTEAGLYDCTTYTAGVSGSCWLQSLYLTSLGKRSFGSVISHIKSRIGVHIAYPPKALETLNSEPTNKYLLRGLVEKLKTGYSSFGLVDLYGLLLGTRLLVPENELVVNHDDLKLSSQRKYVDDGSQPLPIYTAVRHEIPFVGGENEANLLISEEVKELASEKRESWFQWFELTPYEFFCEDLEAGIPTWAMGRRFENGVNVDHEVPELKLPLLFGIFGSAFCATLSHYYHEIRPFVTSVGLFMTLDKMVLDRNNDLVKVHPIDPASIPNYVKGLKESLPKSCPTSLWDAESINLMDAGMSNNLACYPLLRQGRDVEILIAFDSSAEIQSANWIGFTEGYAKQRKIQGWPVSIGWPKKNETAEEVEQELEGAQAISVSEAQAKFEEAQGEDHRKEKVGVAAKDVIGKCLGHCTVWVGSKEVRDSDEEPPKSKAVEEDWELLKPDAGIAVVYFPLIPNEKVPGVDPEVNPYLSTWNFEWTPEQVDQTVALAKANFQDGADKVRRTVRAVYERKKKMRLEREARERAEREREEEVHHEEIKRRHGTSDHFS